MTWDLEQQLQERGELIIRMDSGHEYELHNHNVDFEPHLDGKIMVIETGDETEWVDPGKVESIRWHFDK